MITRVSTMLAVLLGAATPLQAHQIWIEQPADGNATIRFGEFGDNLRETSPGLLDKFGAPTGTLISTGGEKQAEAAKTEDGLTLPFRAAPGDSIVAQDARYPLYTWKETTSWFRPAARLITGFDAAAPKLTLDLVPAGQPGQFKLFFKGEPKPKTKVAFVTQSGWSKEGWTDEQGLVAFDMPWKGTYVAEVSVNEPAPGEREATGGPEKYDAVSYVTSVTYVKPDGLAPLPAGPVGTPSK